MMAFDSITTDLDINNAIPRMDIQGYEAYALEGAKEFVKARVPLVADFSPEELRFFESLERFIEIKANSAYKYMVNLVDDALRLVPLKRDSLLVLSDRLLKDNTFNDLLLLP